MAELSQRKASRGCLCLRNSAWPRSGNAVHSVASVTSIYAAHLARDSSLERWSVSDDGIATSKHVLISNPLYNLIE